MIDLEFTMEEREYLLKWVFIHEPETWDQDIDAMEIIRNIISEPDRSEGDFTEMFLWLLDRTSYRLTVKRLHHAIVLGVIFDNPEEELLYCLTYMGVS